MYLNFYRLRRQPFHITPDPSFLYLSHGHKQALGSIIYGVRKRKGFIEVIGEVGTGKTTILRTYLENVNRTKTKPIYIFNANLTFRDLVATILEELGCENFEGELFAQVRKLQELLIEEYKKGVSVVLLVDEAQNVPASTMENLRMLSNIETTKDKLLQIVLVGQPELDEKLSSKELRQLKQRMAVRVWIEPLSKEDSVAYIHHRLTRAGGDPEAVFSRGALAKIVRKAKGIPRVLNILCDNALATGFGYQKKPVTAKIVREIIRDFDGKPRGIKAVRNFGVAAAVALVILLCVGTAYRVFLDNGTKREEPTVLPQAEASIAAESVDEVKPTGLNIEKTEVVTEPVVSPRIESFADRAELEEIRENVASLKAALEELELQRVKADEIAAVATEVAVEGVHRPLEAVNAPPPMTSGQYQENGRTWIVKKGDYLSAIALKTYGFTNMALIEWLKKHNPHITNEDWLHVGMPVKLPSLQGFTREGDS